MQDRIIVATAAASLLLAVSGVSGAAEPVGRGNAPRAPAEVKRITRGTLTLEGVQELDAALASRLDGYLAARGASFQDFLPDGAMLIGTRFGDVEQVHRVAMPLGAREQLTFYQEPTSAARAPRGAAAAGFTFLKDRGGDENAQVFFYSLADRSVRMLTDGKSLHGGVVWAHDGKRIAFHGNGRDGIHYDIYVADTSSNALPRMVVAGQRGNWSVLDWSPDDSRLLLRNVVSISEGYLYIADLASGALTPLDPGAEGQKIGIGAARFAPGGRSVFFVSDRDSEFARLRQYDLASGSARVLTGFVSWDIEEFDVSSDERYLAYVVNADGQSRLQIIDLGLASERVPPPLPRGIISNLRFDPSGRKLGMTVDSARAPRDVYRVDVDSGAVEQWTRSEVGFADPRSFVDAQLIRFPSWDRENGKPRQIPAFIYRPRTPGPHPVLLSIHGGPEAQSRPGFDAVTQFLVNELGYAVIAPNVRGSTGYGRTYHQLDNGVLREDAVRDIGSLLVWIAAQRDLDAKRVVVAGGSYGGYMVLASLVNYGDRLQAGIDAVGISNFVTFLQNTSAYRRDLRREEYGDERDPKMRAFLNRVSPLTNAAMINRPLLVVQGLNDPRVPASESEQLVRLIRADGGEVWYLAAADEGHGFRKKSNRDVYQRSFVAFLKRLNP